MALVTPEARALPAGIAPLLQLENVEVTYHRAITAVQGLSIAVAPGSITGIIGTNGAGKTTTLQAIAGFLSSDDVEVSEGRILLDGAPIQGRPPHAVARLGVGLIPERDKIFSRLTVEENLRSSSVRHAGGATRRFGIEDAYELFPVLARRRGQVSGYLSGGERQQLAMAMGLVGSPRLLLIDEMSLGLSPVMVSQLADLVRRLRAELGITFLIVEQNALVTVELADYAYVMENGRVVFEGAPDVLVRHDDFREFYLGMGAEQQSSYRDVKEYRRKRRWFG
jgi:branched-chain amino acid transport system ATP-binding protein